jgi:NAD(P)-dependent dehydrogenase (short-subunit alcohol dehydrogenase family)
MRSDFFTGPFLSGQVAIITGAGGGIGGAVAEALGQAGATVYAFDRDGEAAERTAASMRQLGHNASALRCDVTQTAEIEQAVATVVAAHGRIDVLVNNAGVSTMQHAWAITEQEWDHNFDVNVKGVFLCTRATLPQMISQHDGRIINTASVAGMRGVPLLAHYAASKWAVIGYTKSLAIELAPSGITVNAVCPGYVTTPMQEREIGWEAELRGMSEEEVRAEYVRLTPLGRLESPRDVASTILFLTSPLASYITGQAVCVSGGADLL